MITPINRGAVNEGSNSTRIHPGDSVATRISLEPFQRFLNRGEVGAHNIPRRISNSSRNFSEKRPAGTQKNLSLARSDYQSEE